MIRMESPHTDRQAKKTRGSQPLLYYPHPHLQGNSTEVLPSGRSKLSKQLSPHFIRGLAIQNRALTSPGREGRMSLQSYSII